MSTHLFKNITYKLFVYKSYIYNEYMYKQDLVLNNQQRLIGHKPCQQELGDKLI